MKSSCKNCGNLFEGNYCNNCGQAASTHDINAAFIMHDLEHGLMHVNGGILHSTRELFTRPGHAIRDYIEGKRIKHYRPISMLIISAGLYGLLYHAFDINVFEGRTDGLLAYETINEWIAHHFSIISLLLLPILSFSSYVIFRKQGYNFAEHVILNAFYSSQKLFVRILILPFLLWGEMTQLIMQCSLLFDFGLMFWCYAQFFKNLSLGKTFCLTLLANLLNLFILLVITTAILTYMVLHK